MKSDVGKAITSLKNIGRVASSPGFLSLHERLYHVGKECQYLAVAGDSGCFQDLQAERNLPKSIGIEDNVGWQVFAFAFQASGGLFRCSLKIPDDKLPDLKEPVWLITIIAGFIQITTPSLLKLGLFC